MGGNAAVLFCLAQCLIATATAVSPQDARREFLMMLDPLVPAHIARHSKSNRQLEQQQHLRQQVERYAQKSTGQSRRHRKRSTAKHRTFQSTHGGGLTRSLRDTSAEPHSSSNAAQNSRAIYDPAGLLPSSCYHLEQQEVQLLADFDCSMPGVQGVDQDTFASTACAAASTQMQQLNPNSNAAEYNYEEETTIACYVTRSCEDSAISSYVELQVTITLPYHTCAVTLQTLAEQLVDNPHILFKSDPQLASAVDNMRYTPTPDSRAASISAAIQRSNNAIRQAVSISAEEAADLAVYGGMVDEDTGVSPGWLWDPYLAPYDDYSEMNMSIWVAAVCTFGTGVVILSLLALQRGLIHLARRWEERRLVRQAQADAAEAAAEASAGLAAEDEGSEAGSQYDRERSTAGLLDSSRPGRAEAYLLPAVVL